MAEKELKTQNSKLRTRQIEPTEAQKKYDELVRKYQAETDPKKKEEIRVEVVKALKEKQTLTTEPQRIKS